MMASGVIGAQLIYPVTNEQWRRDPKKVAAVAEAMGTVNGQLGESLYPSIHFGGYEVIGGTAAAVEKLAAILPKVDNRYPMILPGHAAFHTPVLQSVSKKALELLPSELFRAPAIPLIDGRGHVWQPLSTDSELLREYTLGHQVVETYDFTAAVTVALKEFAPAKLVLLGPGSTSGGAIGQILVELRWKGIDSKEVFAKFQAEEPFLLAMGLDEQRARLVPETA
jgi:malonyl CoA-acyl carrier protein transacylase